MIASRAVIARYDAGAWRVQNKKKAETALYEAKHKKNTTRVFGLEK